MEEEVSAGKHLLLFEVAFPDFVTSASVRGATLSHPLIRQSGLVGKEASRQPIHRAREGAFPSPV